MLTQADQVRDIGRALDRPLRVEELAPYVARGELEAVMGPEVARASVAYRSTLVDAPERA